MKIKISFTQKQAGIILISLGTLALLTIASYFYFTPPKITGFPELLPSSATAAYVEFPLPLQTPLNKIAAKLFNIEWDKNIASFAGDRAAFAFLKLSAAGAAEKEETLTPLAFIKVSSPEKIPSYIKEKFKTAVINDTLVISLTEKGVDALIAHQSSLRQNLGSDLEFITMRRSHTDPYFAYVKPHEVPEAAQNALFTKLPASPFLISPFSTLSISAQKDKKTWQGKTILTQPKTGNIQYAVSGAYRALLLPYLPEDFELLLAGQNLTVQLKKIDELAAENSQNFPKLATLIKLFTKEYLPDINFEKNIAPLLASEFALTLNGGKALFISEMTNPQLHNLVPPLFEAFKKAAPRLATKEIEITLPDATKAKELIPDPSAIKDFKEQFGNMVAPCGRINCLAELRLGLIEISGVQFGARGIFSAYAQSKLFISNDLITLKKALMLTYEPGRNFRNSDLYRNSLQPILKNPELLGIAKLPNAIFSFSKRMFSDRMEVNFMID